MVSLTALSMKAISLLEHRKKVYLGQHSTLLSPLLGMGWYLAEGGIRAEFTSIFALKTTASKTHANRNILIEEQCTKAYIFCN